MINLILSHLYHRPVRTAVSVLGVALGVVLILVNSGLVNGMQRRRGERESNVRAELIFAREFSLTPVAALSLPTQYQTRLTQIPGVKMATPVGQYLKSSDFGIGFEVVEGIEVQSYFEMTGAHLSEGTLPRTDFEMVVDPEYARTRKAKIGDTFQFLNRTFTISGIYEPECGTARTKIKLSTLQKLLSSPDRCTFLYVQCDNPQNQNQVYQAINAELPGNKLVLIRELATLYTEGIPAFQTFLNAVVGLAVVVCILVVFLAMYTTIIERQYEIGILKSLGASKLFIIGSIEAEAVLMSTVGILCGYCLSFGVCTAMIRLTTLRPEIEPKWMAYAAVIAVVSGAIGSLWPAWRASGLDPVAILSCD
jgi:putative ABC transport system permease protein